MGAVPWWKPGHALVQHILFHHAIMRHVVASHCQWWRRREHRCRDLLHGCCQREGLWRWASHHHDPLRYDLAMEKWVGARLLAAQSGHRLWIAGVQHLRHDLREEGPDWLLLQDERLEVLL